MSNIEEVTLPVEGLVSAKIAAKFLGISESMWAKLLSNGNIEKPVKIGSSARWDVKYLRELGANGVTTA